MKTTAGDVMSTRYQTLSPETAVSDAVRAFKAASNKGRKVFGMMVTDAEQHLVGMISMYDILLFMRPKHVHVWGAMDDIDLAGVMEEACQRAKSIRVGDIMTTEVITVKPATHLLRVMDIMIKKHIRRIPVVENGVIAGIVYISDLFYDLLERLST